jgi:hypothetical protein
VQQFDREVGVAVGEQGSGRGGELPVGGRAAATVADPGRTLDQVGRLECLEVLADGRVGEAELGGQFGRGRRVGALETLDDAALGAREVGGDLCDASRIAI